MLRKALIPVLSLWIFVGPLMAQTDTAVLKSDTSYWKKGGIGTVNFSQVSLSNWAAGGENSLSLQGLINVFAKYKKEKNAFETSFDGAVGILKAGKTPTRKNDDRWEFNAKYGRQSFANKLYYSALLNAKSQFAPGYTYPNDSVIISRFFAPAYILLSLGMDYQPNANFSFYLSPLTGKATIVNDYHLSKAGAFGVDSGERYRLEPGAYFTMKFKRNLMENVQLSTKVDLFSNYLQNPQNVDVNWDVLVSMKINKFMTASINTNLIYDDDIAVPIYQEIAGVKTQVGAGPRIQFREVLGIGLSYKF